MVKGISDSIATGLNTSDWGDFHDSVAAELDAADESESESVTVGWSPGIGIKKIEIW
jgi:hypothetical protein